jgi:hypothetical protein
MLPRLALVAAGRLFKLTAVSVQLVVVAKICVTMFVSRVSCRLPNSRSLTAVTAPCERAQVKLE